MTRSLPLAMARGARNRCPRCGEGLLLERFLTSRAACSRCGLDFSGHRADDAPAYVTMLIVGHVVVGAMLAVEQGFRPAMWVHGAVWLPATLILSLSLLRPVKGALIGVQWAYAMHGFAKGDSRA